jgi:uncharacterized protein (TIGR02996 family)
MAPELDGFGEGRAMTERPDWLGAIRASPEDAAVRLVYADWLDEHDDPARAELIRVQCALAAPDGLDERRVKALRQREKELLGEHRDTWLGPLAPLLADDWVDGTRLQLRRGFVEAASLPAAALLRQAADVEGLCPALREMTLFRVRGRGEELARCPVLGQLAALEVADWMTGADAGALAASPHLQGLRSLRIWLGSTHDEDICAQLARPGTLPGLRELQLVQLYGGVVAGDAADELRARADRLATDVNRRLGKSVARVERPFERLFPIRECLRGLYAGHLPGQRQGLFAFQYHGSHVIAAQFDSGGSLIDAQQRNLVGALVPEGYRDAWIYEHEQDMRDYLRREFGFQPGLIHIKEFTTEWDLAVYLFHDTEVLENPDAWAEDPEPDESAVGPPSLIEWMEIGNFVLLFGNDNWAGPDGLIHTT